MRMKPTALLSDIGERAKSARKRRGWTQAEAARAVGISLRRYGAIERGDAENLTSETIDALVGNLLHSEEMDKGSGLIREPGATVAYPRGNANTGTFDKSQVFMLVIKTKTSTIRLPVVAVGMPVIEGEPVVTADTFELE